MNIKNKTVLLTGASRGIGPYIAKTLAQESAFVIGVARSNDGLLKTGSEVKEAGGHFHPLPFDLKNIDQFPSLLESANSINGEIDILVNNAGIEGYKEYENYSAEEIANVLTVNLHAPMELTRLILPSMKEHGGHIVNIASLAGKKGVAYDTHYSASKAGLIMWTDGMRQELRDSKVNISVICPGYIAETGMFYDDHVDPPALLGTSKPQKVADAVLKAIQQNKAEIIVNKGPIKPLLTIGQLSPKLSDALVRMFGVLDVSRKRVK